MRNREARQLAAGEVIRSLPTALGYSRLAQRYTHTVAYVGGPSFAPWIVTTEGIQFAPWEVEWEGYQGVEYLRTGRLTLPMSTGRDQCMDVRLGRLPLAEVVRSIEEQEAELCLLTYGTPHVPESATARRDHSAGRSPLPIAPDRERIDRFLVEVYTEVWETIWR